MAVPAAQDTGFFDGRGSRGLRRVGEVDGVEHQLAGRVGLRRAGRAGREGRVGESGGRVAGPFERPRRFWAAGGGCSREGGFLEGFIRGIARAGQVKALNSFNFDDLEYIKVLA
jgi:hypothetical protein